MLLKFKVPVINRNLVCKYLESIYLVEKQTLFSTLFSHSKTLPSLVQACKTLPFVVSKLQKKGPYLS